MRKIIVERKEKTGDTGYDMLVGMYDTVEDANEAIKDLNRTLTKKERERCTITALWYDVDETGDIVYEEGGYRVDGVVIEGEEAEVL